MDIAIVCIGAWLARCLGSLTPVNYSIWALLLGSVSGIGGYISPKPLQRGSAYGLMMIEVFGSIIPSLAKVSIADLGMMAVQTVVLFILAVADIFIISYILPITNEQTLMTAWLASITPVGVNICVFAQQYDCDYELSVITVCLSTILSVVTIPVMFMAAQAVL